jgi:hypothetical protein
VRLISRQDRRRESGVNLVALSKDGVRDGEMAMILSCSPCHLLSIKPLEIGIHEAL